MDDGRAVQPIEIQSVLKKVTWSKKHIWMVAAFLVHSEIKLHLFQLDAL